MDRRMMICSMAATAMVTPLAAFAQGEVKARIGWLAVGPIPSNMAAFRAAMQRRGYVEGQNLVLQERYAGTVEQYRQQTADLIRLKVDVLVTTGGVASHAAKLATDKIPIVFLTTNPVESGLAQASLVRLGISPGSRSLPRTSMPSASRQSWVWFPILRNLPRSTTGPGH